MTGKYDLVADDLLRWEADADLAALLEESRRRCPNWILGRSISIAMCEEARLMKTPERARLTREEQAKAFFQRYTTPPGIRLV